MVLAKKATAITATRDVISMGHLRWEPHIRTAHMIWPRLGFGGALVKSQICGLGETVGSTLGSDSCEKSKSTP